MSPETVLDALKAMGKATAREVAARLQVEPRDALVMLNEQQDLGAVTFLNGYWSLAVSGDIKPVLPVAPAKVVRKPEVRGEVPEPVNLEVVIGLLRKNGRMSTSSLAEILGRNGKGMTSTMRALARQGLVNKIGQGKGVQWALPEENSLKQSTVSVANSNDSMHQSAKVPTESPEPERVAEASPTTTAEVVKSIPSFTESRDDDLIIPSPQVMTRIIRKAKHNLRELEQIRQLSVAVKKCRKLLDTINTSKQEQQR
ncbi:DUF1627 domain-containing protein [Salmonella enterica]|nr:DUF1627 domain-containing protein [Salmonella enterica]